MVQIYVCYVGWCSITHPTSVHLASLHTHKKCPMQNVGASLSTTTQKMSKHNYQPFSQVQRLNMPSWAKNGARKVPPTSRVMSVLLSVSGYQVSRKRRALAELTSNYRKGIFNKILHTAARKVISESMATAQSLRDKEREWTLKTSATGVLRLMVTPAKKMSGKRSLPSPPVIHKRRKNVYRSSANRYNFATRKLSFDSGSAVCSPCSNNQPTTARLSSSWMRMDPPVSPSSVGTFSIDEVVNYNVSPSARETILRTP